MHTALAATYVLPKIKICKGGMKKFGICSQWLSETFLIIIILLSMFWAFGTCSRGVSPELVRGQRLPKVEQEASALCGYRKVLIPPWKLISELPSDEQGGAKKLRRALTGWGTGKISWKSPLSSPFNRDLRIPKEQAKTLSLIFSSTTKLKIIYIKIIRICTENRYLVFIISLTPSL